MHIGKNIILATDGSTFSQQAAHYIADANLVPEGGTLYVVHVTSTLPAHVTRYLDHQTIQGWYADEAAKALDPITVILTSTDLPFVVKPLVGTPAQVIVQQADELDARMIVMGSHGRGMVADAMIGSVANRVLALSKRPVLLIP